MESEQASVGAYLRANKDAITSEWVRVVLDELPALRALPRPLIVDHLPEVLEALACWVEGREDDAREGFEVLSTGHALQRLGHGVEADVLAAEYSRLRRVVLRHLLAVPSSAEVREQLVRVDEALDHAVNDAMLVYSRRRAEIREQFIAILAHDLRSPLGAVKLSGDTLLEVAGGDPQVAGVAVHILRSAGRMQRMIESVLDFARGHLGGGIPAVPVALDMGDLCQLAAEELQAAHPRLSVKVERHGDLRGSWDGDRVHQALSNLLANAARHGGGGAVTVTARETDDRRHVVTTVHNRGPRIPAEALPTLFDPFYRAPSEHRRGLGLGLAIVRMIAAAHGASCSVTSTDEDGTTFTIDWPRTPLDETPSSRP